MKLKIFAVPLLILTIIVFTIWVLAPSYFAVKDELKKLGEANQKVEDIKSKLQVASKLNQELLERSEEQKIITDYLPEQKEEEEVINYLNDLSIREGLTATEFSVASKNEQLAAPVVDDTGVMTTEINTTPTVQYVDANFSGAGSYEKIKDFLAKLNNIKRLNKISTIRISKNAPTEGENSPAGELIIKATSGFGYLEKIKNVSDINNKALATSMFDLSVVDYIKNNKNTEFTELNLDVAGKSDPFAP